MQGNREQVIRERAYALWEAEGRPDGKAVEHWLRAEAEISGTAYAGVTEDGKFVAPSLKEQARTRRRRSGST